jgi:hypothetical protein
MEPSDFSVATRPTFFSQVTRAVTYTAVCACALEWLLEAFLLCREMPLEKVDAAYPPKSNWAGEMALELTGCSCREPQFDTRHPPVTPALGNLMPPCGFSGCCTNKASIHEDTNTHTHAPTRTHANENKSFHKNQINECV